MILNSVSADGTVAVNKVQGSPKKRGLSMVTKRNLMGYLFVLPFILGLAFVFIPGLVLSVRFAFSEIIIKDLSQGGGYTLNFIGLENINFLVAKDPNFIRGILESTGTMFLNVIIVLIYSLLIATILNRDISGKGFYRAVLFLPVVISTGVILMVDGATLSQGYAVVTKATGSVMGGLFNEADISQMLASLELGDFGDIIVSAANNIYSIITTSGVQLVIFLAGLQSISPSIYESATVEGCTWWESFWKITIPMISPLILVNLVYSVVDAFTRSNNAVMADVYTKVSAAEFEMASAEGYLYLLAVGIILAILVAIVSKFIFYENK